MIKTKFLAFATLLSLGMACVQDPETSVMQQNESSIEAKIINSAENAVDGELILYVSEDTANMWLSATSATRSGDVVLDEVAAELGAISIEPLFNLKMNADKKIALGMHRWFVVEFDKSVELEEAAVKYAENHQISRVQYNSLISRPEVHSMPVSSDAEVTRASATPFNDPRLVDSGTITIRATLSSILMLRRVRILVPLVPGTIQLETLRLSWLLSTRVLCTLTPTWRQICGLTKLS